MLTTKYWIDTRKLHSNNNDPRGIYFFSQKFLIPKNLMIRILLTANVESVRFLHKK